MCCRLLGRPNRQGRFDRCGHDSVQDLWNVSIAIIFLLITFDRRRSQGDNRIINLLNEDWSKLEERLNIYIHLLSERPQK